MSEEAEKEIDLAEEEVGKESDEQNEEQEENLEDRLPHEIASYLEDFISKLSEIKDEQLLLKEFEDFRGEIIRDRYFKNWGKIDELVTKLSGGPTSFLKKLNETIIANAYKSLRFRLADIKQTEDEMARRHAEVE